MQKKNTHKDTVGTLCAIYRMFNYVQRSIMRLTKYVMTLLFGIHPCHAIHCISTCQKKYILKTLWAPTVPSMHIVMHFEVLYNLCYEQLYIIAPDKVPHNNTFGPTSVPYTAYPHAYVFKVIINLCVCSTLDIYLCTNCTKLHNIFPSICESFSELKGYTESRCYYYFAYG